MKLSFLVVEDHDFQRDVLVRMLKELDARAVFQAADGHIALEILDNAENHVDIVITDLDMPHVDGMELLRRMARGGHKMSVIVASSLERGLLASTEAMAAAYGINLLGTIEKPVTPQKLQELIRLHGRSGGAAPETQAVTPYPAFSADELLQALRNDEFEPFFQPQVHIATGRVRGAEALVRWRHPRHGVVPAAAFVRALEDCGAAVALTLLMVKKAAETSRLLRNAAQPSMIAVNISQQSFADIGLADRIADIVRGHDMDAEDLVLEISESATTIDFGNVLGNLIRLRMKGFGLAIDDYGTGHSSLEQLTQIPFTALKIDQAFMSYTGKRGSTRVILQSSLELARSLRIISIAEGVETRQNWDLLSELNCDIAQGHYIAAPMCNSDYLEWIGSWVASGDRGAAS